MRIGKERQIDRNYDCTSRNRTSLRRTILKHKDSCKVNVEDIQIFLLALCCGENSHEVIEEMTIGVLEYPQY